ncbi:MAG TPA: DUF6458 family protein [Actinomycetota bacterium]|nr:DUF6458 family protein [Actinomycetota bacterium]
MGIGASLFLIAIGLILALAVGDGSYILGDFSVTTAGWILTIVGVLGLIISMMFWGPWAARRGDNTTVIHDREREIV